MTDEELQEMIDEADRDGDGVMDHATVFATGFNDEVDGLAAGVLARNGKVWFTNIPHLWLLEDKDGDGKAEQKKSLASGFGVRVGFLGHDLHGLRQGPDGRIYFSIGDRAASVTTLDGRKLHTPLGSSANQGPHVRGAFLSHITPVLLERAVWD